LSELVAIEAGGRAFDIEHAWVGVDDDAAPVLVFLHEGLGSLSMWRDFPQRVSRALGVRGLVYSRPGYGRSTPRAEGERWPVSFMHDQARDVLPALLDALGVRAPYGLFGHSDGGSIALIHAALHPERTRCVIAMAPHIVVEVLSVASIAATRETYLNTDLKARLARHHADPDSAFWGWNHIWLDPAFGTWTLEPLLPSVACPVLAIQGEDDEYGTMAQIDGIAEAMPAGRCRLLKLPACGHAPHRDQPEAVIEASAAFWREAGAPAPGSPPGEAPAPNLGPTPD
jgi:pimeloyl-ACP methyl ester carboxylesterase